MDTSPLVLTGHRPVDAMYLMLEEQREALLAELAGWPAERLSYQPDSSAWSALQVVDHLVRTESAFLEEAFIQLPKAHTVPPVDRMKLEGLLWLFRRKVRVKTPSSVSSILPGNTPELVSLIMMWQQTRAEWESLLRSPLARSRAAALRHPVAGWLSLRGALRFLSVHIRHHRYQLDRLR